MTKASPSDVLGRIFEAMRDSGKPATQTAVAKLLEIAQPSVHEWKKAYPSLKHALELATKLNVCVEWIYTGRGCKRPGAPMEWVAQDLWDLWPRLPEAVKQQLLGHAQMSITAIHKPKKLPELTIVRQTRKA